MTFKKLTPLKVVVKSALIDGWIMDISTGLMLTKAAVKMFYRWSMDEIRTLTFLCEAVVSSQRSPPVLCVNRTAALQVRRGDDSWNVKSILVSSWRSVSAFVLSMKKGSFVHLHTFFYTQDLIFLSFFCVLNFDQFS